jgi:flagellar biosynthetic protein FliQ
VAAFDTVFDREFQVAAGRWENVRRRGRADRSTGAYDCSSCGGPDAWAGASGRLAVSVFQTTTSIQEQTLAFIPKIIAVFVAILIFGPWMLRIMVEYVSGVFTNLPMYIG